MRELPAIKASVDLPFSAAVNELTGFECLAIEQRFRKPFHELGGMTLAATVWAFENRDGNTRSWDSVLGMSLREMTGYFEPEPSDVDDDDPDSDMGKGSGRGR